MDITSDTESEDMSVSLPSTYLPTSFDQGSVMSDGEKCKCMQARSNRHFMTCSGNRNGSDP